MTALSPDARAEADERPPLASFEAGGAIGLRVARDDIIVPRASTGATIDIFGRFVGVYANVLFDTGLHLGMGALFDRDAHPAASIAHGLRLAALPMVMRAQDRWSLAIGPTLVWSTDVLWLAKWDDAHGYWMGNRWLGPGARAWTALSPTWRLDVSGDASLFGLQSRPPGYRANKQEGLTHVSYYFADVNRSPELGWFGDFQSVRASVELHHAREASTTIVPVGLGLGVDVRFEHTERPAAAYLFETMLHVSKAWGVR